MNKPPVTKNQELTLKISDLSYQGMGVAKIERYPLFIANALPEETVVAHVLKAGKNFGFAKVKQRLTDSPQRATGIEEKYTQTGIAPLQHLKYAAQLAFKRTQIKELLKKAHMDEIEVAPTLGMEDPYHYRNKAQVPVRMLKGQLETGFFRQSSHKLIPMENFLIQEQRIDEVIKSIRDIVRKYQIIAYNEDGHSGTLRHIVVRRGHYSHEVMVILVSRTKRIPQIAQITHDILAECPDVVSVIQNINQEKTNVILGTKDRLLAGKEQITDSLNGIKFAISAHSFYQVNSVQTEKLYQEVAKRAELTGTETVIDAYCGIGTISLNLAAKAKKVYGVEIVPEAITDAQKNAEVNGINNVEFKTGSANEWMAKWSEEKLVPDVVVFDPPRKGLDNEVIKSTLELAPQKIVYVSCNPATLVRDLKEFTNQGYKVKEPILPVDQFPQTVHVESVTVLARAK
ncbi:23S rRNA (uracil(1939)-C(5))-methyltransferase RlmD [Liquorilactobacillus oeni]|uniref:tRNA (Uracil-5-)-methyltransferase n=1 Tax=Liquorilactobacillus oeni DSM 19972 TaxID=1423777 RepID=A0A0R1MFD7_9LACO|nr:23S rRNA (uracil(1939)-C(5))-methyltransferase RlmD [Liquorilactobacillus oeni]KRL04021.1 tRNA (Uracil-5-) -methyltransferase [Liquorilactobacillus oeni DSM 19972]